MTNETASIQVDETKQPIAQEESKQMKDWELAQQI